MVFGSRSSHKVGPFVEFVGNKASPLTLNLEYLVCQCCGSHDIIKEFLVVAAEREVTAVTEKEGNCFGRCVISGKNQGSFIFGDFPSFHFLNLSPSQGLQSDSFGSAVQVWDRLGCPITLLIN